MAFALAIWLSSAFHGWGMRIKINRLGSSGDCEALTSYEQCDDLAQIKCPTECAELVKTVPNQAPEKESIMALQREQAAAVNSKVKAPVNSTWSIVDQNELASAIKALHIEDGRKKKKKGKKMDGQFHRRRWTGKRPNKKQRARKQRMKRNAKPTEQFTNGMDASEVSVASTAGEGDNQLAIESLEN